MSAAVEIVEFAPFRLDAARRVLTRDGHPVALSSRAFDILTLLVEHRDRVMTKDEIITHVWRGIVVEENNLAVQVSALRRALGEADLDAPLILTVPGQGYRFVGRITKPAGVAPAALPNLANEPDPPENLPAKVTAPAAGKAPPRASQLPMLWALGAGGLGIAMLTMWLLRHAAPPAPPSRPPPPRLSIAVLPFRDLSDDRCCAYLADAVSDDLTTDLSHIPGSMVIARESSDGFRDKSMPTADIGRALNVRYLLEGSLRAVEGNFSINAQLIDAATGGHLWAERFTVPRNHLGEAQTSMVHRLASALGVTLIQIEGSAASRARSGDPDALDLFFRARSILDRSDTLSAMTEAQHLLEQALVKQPDFADGLAELAWLLARKVHGFTYPAANADLAEARQVADNALRVMPNSAVALAARGVLLSHAGQCEQARSVFEAALAAEPESVPARSGLIACLTQLGQFEAAVQGLQELLQIDPEGARAKVRYYQLGFANVMLGKPREALAWLARSDSGDPEPEPGADDLGRVEWTSLYRIAALQMVGDNAAARAAFARYSRVWRYRSAWQIGASLTKAQSALPGFGRFIDALVAAGMPRTMDEHADMGAAPLDRVTPHRAFEPTPSSIPGAAVIDTAGLRARLGDKPAPRVVNVGSRAVVLPGTVKCVLDDPPAPPQLASCTNLLRADAAGGAVVVMGVGPTDWTGYDGALALKAAGVGGILWYRGGEESWAAAGGPFTDMRP